MALADPAMGEKREVVEECHFDGEKAVEGPHVEPLEAVEGPARLGRRQPGEPSGLDVVVDAPGTLGQVWCIRLCLRCQTYELPPSRSTLRAIRRLTRRSREYEPWPPSCMTLKPMPAMARASETAQGTAVHGASATNTRRSRRPRARRTGSRSWRGPRWSPPCSSPGGRDPTRSRPVGRGRGARRRERRTTRSARGRGAAARRGTPGPVPGGDPARQGNRRSTDQSCFPGGRRVAKPCYNRREPLSCRREPVGAQEGAGLTKSGPIVHCSHRDYDEDFEPRALCLEGPHPPGRGLRAWPREDPRDRGRGADPREVPGGDPRHA